LSGGLRSFDRGSAELARDPNAALAAFREARDAFQRVIDGGVRSAALYYNLGNTHVRLGEVGEAIAAYRKSLRLNPADEKVLSNLRFARSLTQDQIAASGEHALLHTVFSWHYALPLRTRVVVASVFYVAFWLLLIVRRFHARVDLRYLLLATLVVWGPMVCSVGVTLRSEGRVTEGVVVSPEVIVRTGNGEGYARQFSQPLHEGVEFRVVEDRGAWVHVELPDGNTGWVRREDVALF
jgi:Tetratricopeptide repeat